MVSLGWKLGLGAGAIGAGALGITALAKGGKAWLDNLNPFKKLGTIGSNAKASLTKVSEKIKANQNKIKARREVRKAENAKKKAERKQKASEKKIANQAKVQARRAEVKAKIQKIQAKPLPKITQVIKNAKPMPIRASNPVVNPKPASQKIMRPLPRMMVAKQPIASSQRAMRAPIPKKGILKRR